MMRWSVLMCFFAGCATSAERDLNERWSASAASFEASGADETTVFDGTLRGYQTHALSRHPELRGEHAMWSSRISQVSRGRRLPDPSVMVDVMAVAPHEVGLMMVGVSQEIPWPGRLDANVAAATATAAAQENRVGAMASDVTTMVTDAYWPLWRLRQIRALQREHLTVVRGLSQAVSGRLSLGSATLADQQQVDLEAAKLEDELATLAEEERVLVARLAAAVGGESSTGRGDLGTLDEPILREVGVSRESLAAAVAAHPRLEVYRLEAAANEEAARAEATEGMPHFMVDSKWLFDEASLTVGGSVSLPIWRSSYEDAADAMMAEAVARRFARQARYDQSMADLDEALSQIRDSARRARWVVEVLIPQADAAYSSLLVAYASGRGEVAQLLMTQRDLLDLRILGLRAKVDHEMAWAKLENLVGAPVLAGQERVR